MAPSRPINSFIDAPLTRVSSRRTYIKICPYLGEPWGQAPCRRTVHPIYPIHAESNEGKPHAAVSW